MKYKLRIITGTFLMIILLITAVHTLNAESVEQARERKQLMLSEVLDGEQYVNVNLGGAYLGKSAEYDRSQKRTIILPNDGANQTVIRKKNKATVFYGKYRGKDEYEDYRENFPELDAEIFLTPIKEAEISTAEIKENDYRIHITDEAKKEKFLIALSYIGAIDNEMFTILSVDILFDEACRPMEVRFELSAEGLEDERVEYQEQQLVQTYEYSTKEVFQSHFSEIEKAIKEIVPIEDVEIIDYIDELSNVVKMVDEHFLLVLLGETKELEREAGWDRAAIFAYLEAVDRRFAMFSRGYEGEQITQEEYLEQLERVYQTAHQIGSDVYTYMFASSSLSAKKKTLLVLDQMDCYLDENGMLQMGDGDSFAAEMTPHSEFLEDYAECVRLSYQKQNKKYKQLDNEMIHQYRMYIDRHNIEYVRNYFTGKTDYEKLRNYAESFEIELYYGEPSRHHNKIERNGSFKAQEYDKIMTPNHLSEFIVNVKTGEFVTEWDVLKPNGEKNLVSAAGSYKAAPKNQGRKLVDTESFNYAPAEYVDAHQMLDVLPATPAKGEKASLYLENQLKRMLKDIWKSPAKKEYKEKYRKPKDYLW